MAVTLLVKQVSLEEHHASHQRVQWLHGETGQFHWRHTRDQVMEHIRNGDFDYFFLKEGRAVRIVVARLADGMPFLKAETDGEMPRTLLELPVFNAPAPQPEPAATHA